MAAERRKIRFVKMHGCGNDYVYVDTMKYPIHNPSQDAVAWSCRHIGIGSDGLVLIGRPSVVDADHSMRIFNADGSEAMMCGNACRCVGKYLYENRYVRKMQIRLQTKSGIKVLHLNVNSSTDEVDSVTVDMGEPSFFPPSQLPLPLIGGGISGCFVSMGNPHIVYFVENVDAVDVASEGSKVECHPSFPERCNVEFAEIRPDGIRVRVWERGSGITMACGTGACATAVAAVMSKKKGRRNRIMMDGGVLEVEWRESDNHVYLTGPATFVFEGEIACIE